MGALILALTLAASSAPAPVADALADAASADPKRHERLGAELETAAFLETLDGAAEYRNAARVPLHAEQVVTALAKNPAPSARVAFIALTASKVYLAHEERVIGLIRAGVEVRPAPEALVRFWDGHSRRDDDGFTPTTIAALIDNGSPPAIALLERKLADPAHHQDEKRAWMRGELLSHRNDVPLLQGCERLLARTLDKRLRPALVEVLFDYRPEQWYRPASTYSPPPLAEASPEARALLKRIAKRALGAGGLDRAQQAAVRRRLRELAALPDETVR